MKHKFWNFVENEGKKKGEVVGARTLLLNGEISDETWFGDEVTPGQFKDELNAGTGDIEVWVNSPGGDVFAGAQIYNMLREYDGKVTVKIDSLAASAASVIAMAGDEVHMSPVAMMMIHNPSTIAMGNAADMQKAVDMLSEIKESILNAYEAKTNLSREVLSDLMDGETWFNAKKALEMGFCDKIMFAEEKDMLVTDAVMLKVKDMAPVIADGEDVHEKEDEGNEEESQSDSSGDEGVAASGETVHQCSMHSIARCMEHLELLAH